MEALAPDGQCLSLQGRGSPKCASNPSLRGSIFLTGVDASADVLLSRLSAETAVTLEHRLAAGIQHCSALLLLTASLERTIVAERRLGPTFGQVRKSDGSESDSGHTRDRELYLPASDCSSTVSTTMSKATSSSTTAVQTVPPVDPYRNLSSLLRVRDISYLNIQLTDRNRHYSSFLLERRTTNLACLNCWTSNLKPIHHD